MAHNRTLLPVNQNYQKNNLPPGYILTPINNHSYQHGRCFVASMQPQACVCCQHGQYMHQTPQIIAEFLQQPVFENNIRKIHIGKFDKNVNAVMIFWI